MLQSSHTIAPNSGEIMHYRIPIESDWAPTIFDLWRHIARVVTNSWDELLASQVHNPTIRYFFKILPNTIFGRFNSNKVNSKELFFLHCILSMNTKINASSFILQHIGSLCAILHQPFLIGRLVTTIAHNLNLQGHLENLQSLPPMFMDLDNCRSTRLIKNIRDGTYNMMVKNKEVPSVVVHFNSFIIIS